MLVEGIELRDPNLTPSEPVSRFLGQVNRGPKVRVHLAPPNPGPLKQKGISTPAVHRPRPVQLEAGGLWTSLDCEKCKILLKLSGSSFLLD